PYPGNRAKLTFVSPYPAERVGIFVPPSVQVSGPGLSSAGTEQGFSVYMMQSVAANVPFTVSISGTASPPPQGAVGTDAGQDAAGSSAQAPTATATTLPARLDSLKWTIAIGFAAIFALGLIFLFRQPQMLAEAGIGSSPIKLKGGSLDDLKENIFKLELR